MARPPRNCSHVDGPRRVQPDIDVGGGDHQVAAGKVGRHQGGEAGLRGAVEADGRLVEQPQGPLHERQPRQRQPPLLPGRQQSRLQPRDRRQVERGKPGRHIAVAQKVAPEAEVLARRQRRLEGVLVGDEVALLGKPRLGRSALQRQAPGRRLDEPGDHAEQTRLAAAVGPPQHHKLARAELEDRAPQTPPCRPAGTPALPRSAAWPCST
jgi:hypothetical protein